MFLPSRSGNSNARKRTNYRNNNTTSTSGKDILLKAQLEREARQRAQLEKKAALVLQNHFRLFLYRANVYNSLIQNKNNTNNNNNNVYLKDDFEVKEKDKWFFNNESILEAINLIYESIEFNFVNSSNTNGNDTYLNTLNEALKIDQVKIINTIDIIFKNSSILSNDISLDNNSNNNFLNLIFYKYFITSETIFFGLLLHTEFANFFGNEQQIYLNENNFKILNLSTNDLNFFRNKSILVGYGDYNLPETTKNIVERFGNVMVQYPNIKNSILSIWNSILNLENFDEVYLFTSSLTKNKDFINNMKEHLLSSKVFLLMKVLFDKSTALFQKYPINSIIIFNIYVFFYLASPEKLNLFVDRHILNQLDLINKLENDKIINLEEFKQFKLFYFLKNNFQLTDGLKNLLTSYYNFFFQKPINNKEYSSLIDSKKKITTWPVEFYILDRVRSYVEEAPFHFDHIEGETDEERIEKIINKLNPASFNNININNNNNMPLFPISIDICLSSFPFKKLLWEKIFSMVYKGPMNAEILIQVDRNNFFNDLMYHLNSSSGSSFAVEYKGEQGRGYGLKKDFLSEASKMFFYDLNLFSVSGNGDGLVPNQEFLCHSVLKNLGLTETLFTNEQLVKNAGKILAFLLLEGFTIPYKFSYWFWRKFLLTLFDLYYFNRKKTFIYENEFIDLQYHDYELYSNLEGLFKLNEEELKSLDLYMEYEGIELVPNGNEIPVTYENLHFYIKKITDFKLNNKGLDKFMEYFVKGFKLVMQDEFMLMVLSTFIFNEGKDISLIVNGDSLERFPIDDFISNLKLQGYNEDDKTIKDLIYILKNDFTNDQLIKFFHFITSLRAPPFNGFGSLNPLICITKITDPDFIDSKHHLPSSSTCFNLLRLPDYKNKDILLEKLTIAIEDKGGFNLA
ncbi:hypothetical protein ACO0SA_003388 [Hanseniaspora valbyensis]